MHFRVVFRHTFLPVSATNHCCTCLMLVSGTSLVRFSIFPSPLLWSFCARSVWAKTRPCHPFSCFRPAAWHWSVAISALFLFWLCFETQATRLLTNMSTCLCWCVFNYKKSVPRHLSTHTQRRKSTQWNFLASKTPQKVAHALHSTFWTTHKTRWHKRKEGNPSVQWMA